MRESPCHYKHLFTDARRPAWREFWKSIDGSVQRALEFAKTAGVPDPPNFVADLHRFLFYVWPGDTELLRADASGQPPKAFRGGFSDFVQKVAKDHIENPKADSWYRNKGTTSSEFVRALQLEGVPASDDLRLIGHINRFMPDFGRALYEAFLLLNFGANAQKIAAARAVAADLRAVASAVKSRLGLS